MRTTRALGSVSSRRAERFALWLAALACACLAIAAPAQAQDPFAAEPDAPAEPADPCVVEPADANRRVVRVITPGADADMVALNDAIAEIVAGRPVVVCSEIDAVLRPRDVLLAEGPPGIALGWVFLFRGARHVDVYIADGPWERLLVRRLRLPRDRRVDVVVREEVALIALTAIEALVRGAPIGRPRAEVAREVEPPPPDPARDAPAPPRRRRRALPPPTRPVAFGARYAISAEADGLVSHAIGIDARWAPVPRATPLAFGARVDIVLPHRAGGPEVGVDISHVRAALAVIPRIVTPSIEVLASLGGGIEATHVDPEVAPSAPDLVAASAATTVRPILLATIAVEKYFGAFALGAFAELAASTRDVHYVIQTSGLDPIVADPFTLRPTAGLRLTIAP